MIPGRPTPDPWVGSSVELSGGDARGLLNLIRIGKALPRQGITTEEAPPALLQIEPAGPFGNEEVVNAGVLSQPGTGFSAVMAAEIISNNEDISGRIVGFDVGQQADVAFRVARSRTASQFFAIAHPQRSIDPGLLRPTTVIHGRFDAVSIGRPAGGWRKGARDYWPEFVGADGRRSLGRPGVVGDDHGSFGTKSLSELSPQL